MEKPNQEDIDSMQPLATLPDKKYFTIGEVVKICALKSHVLRYWEQVFPQLEPSKRRGRRYYQRKDLELVLEIKSLLHEQGFTIPGAKARLVQKSTAVPEKALNSDQAQIMSILKTMKKEQQEFKAYITHRF